VGLSELCLFPDVRAQSQREQTTRGVRAAGEDRGGCLSSRAYARLSHSPPQQATVDSAQADSVFSSMLQLEGPT